MEAMEEGERKDTAMKSLDWMEQWYTFVRDTKFDV